MGALEPVASICATSANDIVSKAKIFVRKFPALVISTDIISLQFAQITDTYYCVKHKCISYLQISKYNKKTK